MSELRVSQAAYELAANRGVNADKLAAVRKVIAESEIHAHVREFAPQLSKASAAPEVNFVSGNYDLVNKFLGYATEAMRSEATFAVKAAIATVEPN